MVAVVLVKGADLSEVVPRAVDLVKAAVKVAKADREQTDKAVIKPKKCTMASPHLLQPAPKAPEMALNGVRQKGENPSIRALESPAIPAKASDF